MPATVTLAAVFAVLLAAQEPPRANEPADQYAPPVMPRATPPSQLVSAVGFLTLMAVAAGGVVLWWARQQAQVSARGTPGSGPLEVVASVSLGGGCALHLLQVDQCCFVVAVDAGGLKAIERLSEPFELLLAAAADPRPDVPFPSPPPPEAS